MKKVMEFLMLPITCLVLGIGLAFTNAFTKPVIQETAIRMANEARSEVLPGTSDFTEINGEFSEGINSVFKGSNGEGIAVEVITKGYGGDMKLMVGIDPQGKITGVKVVSASETAGVGAKVYEKNFLDLFNGRSGQLKAVKTGATADDIQAISGATVSSKAVTAGVNVAQQAFEQIKGEL